MKRRDLVLALGVGGTLAAAPAVAGARSSAESPGDSPADDEAAIRALEDRQTAAMRAGDIETLGALWAESYVVNSPSNSVVRRETIFGLIRAGVVGGYEIYEKSIESLSFVGDIAIVMGQEDVRPRTGPLAGRDLKRRYTNIWRREGEGWISVARHANVIPPPLEA